MENALRQVVFKSEDPGEEEVLILIFLENALRQVMKGKIELLVKVLILIFLENALRRSARRKQWSNGDQCLNPYFFGKCSTAPYLNAAKWGHRKVLILIFLENALRLLP